ncbi:MAG TPA: VWA domain-containing protein [Acidobacteriota bacterium]|nr:VWA domain-containing protein [Acidobacteriota bacterium]
MRLLAPPSLLLFSILSYGVSSLLAQEPDTTPRFRAEVDQVVLYVSVYDRDGNLVTDLKQEEFTIYEDKVEQEITSFAQAEVPSSIGIVYDSSGSMRNKERLVASAVDLFLNMNNPQNELFLIRFDDEVELEEDFTRDVEDIRDAIYNIVIKGGTALYDAIYLSAEKVSEGQEPKKVLVVFTDGEDKDSYYTHVELMEKIRESDTQVFIVAFLDEDLKDDGGFFGIFRSERDKVQNQINEIADITGGKAFFPQDPSELGPVFEQIAKELKNQYRVAYISSNRNKDGNWRQIDVQLERARERQLRVRTRKGYFAGNGPS